MDATRQQKDSRLEAPQKKDNPFLTYTHISSTFLPEASPTFSRSLFNKQNTEQLVFTTIIALLNEAFETDDNGVQFEYELDPDIAHSKESIAGELTNCVSELFPAFMESSSEFSEEVALERFMNLSQEGINRGIALSREILDSHNLLDEELSNDIEELQELVNEGLEDYTSSFGFNYSLTESATEEELESSHKTEDYLDQEYLAQLMS